MAEEREVDEKVKTEDASTNDSLSLARQSTGPRTPRGKEMSKYNAVKHGIFSKVIVLKDEPRAAFDALLNGLFNDSQPQGKLEEVLVEKLATLLWRYRRLIVAEAKSRDNILEVALSVNDWSTDHLLRYESSIERSFDRVLSQLERLQRMRMGQPVPPPIKLDISSESRSIRE